MKYIVILFAIFAVSIISTAKSAEITVSGNTLTYSGDVVMEDATKFEELFTSNIKVVKLTSHGGSSYAGYQIANMLSARYDVVVHAVDHCESACAIMWLGAKQQSKTEEGVVGFHLAYIQDLDYIKDLQDRYGLNGLEYTWKQMTMSNVAKDSLLIDNSAAIPMYLNGLWKDGLLGSDMWYPTNVQLQALEGDFVSLPTEIKKVQLTDSTNWTSFFGNPEATTYYSKGVWTTTVKVVSHTSLVDVSAAIYSGFPKDAVSITVGTDKNNFKYTSIYASDVGAGETVYITLYSKVKPSYVWVYNLTVNAWVYASVL